MIIFMICYELIELYIGMAGNTVLHEFYFSFLAGDSNFQTDNEGSYDWYNLQRTSNQSLKISSKADILLPTLQVQSLQN